ncbi:MAG: ImmA/IrrE family metallo-endopeptidase [Candidatus Cloacimonetes bacterium]|nr:ImmA/IrrE family metallo-endopeptidase [Candidatus Cloacimonadota bacterium]
MNKNYINKEITVFRRKLGLNNIVVEEATLLNILQNDKYYIFYDLFGRDSFSGAAYKEGEIKFIIINSSQSKGRQNFTLAHELGHIILHDKNIFDLTQENVKLEKEADFFATNFLMPEHLLKMEIGDFKKISKMDILMVSQRFRVSFEAALYRLLSIYGKRNMPADYGKIKVVDVISEFNNKNKDNYDKEARNLASSLKIDESLYYPDEKMHYPNNIIKERSIRKYKNGKISFGKLLEFIKFLGLDPDKVMAALK